jgi:hypothetical protein
MPLKENGVDRYRNLRKGARIQHLVSISLDASRIMNLEFRGFDITMDVLSEGHERKNV